MRNLVWRKKAAKVKLRWRWLTALLVMGVVIGVAVWVIHEVKAPNPTFTPSGPSAEEEKTQRYLGELTAELHGIRNRGSFAVAVRSPRYWEIVRVLEQHQAELGPRRPPIVSVLIDFFRYLPENKDFDAECRKLFAAMVAIDASAPDQLVDLWLWQAGAITAARMRSLGMAIVPALLKAMEECKEDDIVRQDSLVGLLAEMGPEVVPQVQARLTHANPCTRRTAAKTLAKMNAQ
jgi:hypothetical protein